MPGGFVSLTLDEAIQKHKGHESIRLIRNRVIFTTGATPAKSHPAFGTASFNFTHVTTPSKLQRSLLRPKL